MSDYTRLEEMLPDDPDEVVRRCMTLLEKDREDAMALFLIGTVYSRAERYGYAFSIFKRVHELKPDRGEPLNNMGMCLSALGEYGQAREYYQKAWALKRTATYAANIGFTFMEMQDHKKAFEWCEKALKLDPDCKPAKSSRGFSKLATGDWETGWKDWGVTLGGKFRKQKQFEDEELWDGTPGKTVVVYGEQGLGDELLYSSCIPDLTKVAKHVIIDCDSRLKNLLARSFPNASVYGTRRAETEWVSKHKIDANCPVGQLPQFFRPSPDSCPGTPYLIADPERRIQWKALFDSWGTKPKIGICWTGGSRHNNPKARTIGLEQFRPLMQAIDADWISLQYKDPTDEIAKTGLPVRHFRRACETDDYDDTAALVAELDFVIGVHTSVNHLTGALGVPAIILVPSMTLWMYQVPSQRSFPWYASAQLFKQNKGEKWSQTITRLVNDKSLRRIRSARSGGVPCVQPVGDREQFNPSSDPPARASHAEGLQRDSHGRQQRFHLQPISDPAPSVV